MKTLRNAVLVLCFALLFAGFSVPASAIVKEGCNPTFNDAQKRHADAMRVRDKAYTRETIKRNDTAVGMTCFDQAMGLTSRLGLIFSDVVTVPPPPNQSVFTPALSYPNFGADEYLMQDLGTVVEPVLSQYLNDFGGTDSDLLGLGTTTSMFGSLLAMLTSPLSSITSALTSFYGSLSSLTSALSTIVTIANFLSLPLPSATVLAWTTFLNTTQSLISSLISSLQSALAAALAPFLSAITGIIGGPATDMKCDRIQKLWKTATPVADASPVEGWGIEGGVPYFSYDDLLSGSPAGVGPDLLGELSAGGNGAVLSGAMSDLTGLFSAPGTLSSWTVSPVFPPGSSTTSIISGM